jgi:hypothetical protein
LAADYNTRDAVNVRKLGQYITELAGHVTLP